MPSERDIQRVYPAAAGAQDIGGRANIKCIVAVTGVLRACEVVSETPTGYGFGAAAMALTPQLLMRPATRDGAPIEASVIVPVSFSTKGTPGRGFSLRSLLPAPPQVAPPGAVPGPGRTVALFRGVLWRTAPTADQVLAAYPAAARRNGVSGRVVLTCNFVAGGALGRCKTTEELPEGQGFARAALELAGSFRGPEADSEGRPARDGVVQVNIAFMPSVGGAASVTNPLTVTAPNEADIRRAMSDAGIAPSVTYGRAVMTCTVAPGGSLGGCAAEDATSPAFAQAAVSLVPRFRLVPWTEEGLPVVGRRVSIPVQIGVAPLEQATVADLARRAADFRTARDTAQILDVTQMMLRRFPGDSRTRNALMSAGILFAETGDFERALWAYDRAVEVTPANATAFNNRCWFKATRRVRIETALADCDLALDLSPGTPNYLDSRGFTYLVLGDLVRARRDYDAALVGNPGLAGSLFGRGIVRLRSGDPAGGEADIQAAIKADPEIEAEFRGYGVVR